MIYRQTTRAGAKDLREVGARGGIDGHGPLLARLGRSDAEGTATESYISIAAGLEDEKDTRRVHAGMHLIGMVVCQSGERSNTYPYHVFYFYYARGPR